MGFCYVVTGFILGVKTWPAPSATWKSWSSCWKCLAGSAECSRLKMAIVRIPDENRTLDAPVAITSHLASIGIDYERWEPAHTVESHAAPEAILAAYSAEVEKLKQRGGYVTADVID